MNARGQLNEALGLFDTERAWSFPAPPNDGSLGVARPSPRGHEPRRRSMKAIEAEAAEFLDKLDLPHKSKEKQEVAKLMIAGRFGNCYAEAKACTADPYPAAC